MSNQKDISTAALRGKLSEILEDVKHKKYDRVRVLRHKKVQAEIISQEQASLLFDLTKNDLERIRRDIDSYLRNRENDGRPPVNLDEVIR